MVSLKLPSFGQLRALTYKTFLVAVVRHPIAILLKSYIIPITFIALLLNIHYFTRIPNVNGVGSPSPIPSLAETIVTTNKPLYIVKRPDLGKDVDDIIYTITKPLRPESVRFVEDDERLLAECLANIRGVSSCHGAITFKDSPLTTTSDEGALDVSEDFDLSDEGSDDVGKSSEGSGAEKKGIHEWKYSIRGDPGRKPDPYNVFKHDGNLESFYLPMQVAVDNAIMNSTLTPRVFLFTGKTQEEVDESLRLSVVNGVASWYGFAFFLCFLSQVFHLSELVSKERESGMSQLVDAMGGNATARVVSYLAVFNAIYLPCWIIFGLLHWRFLWPTSSAALPILSYTLLGLSMNSFAVFAASLLRRARTSPIYVGVGSLLVSVLAMFYANHDPSPIGVGFLSLLFPSANQYYLIQFMCYWEYTLRPAVLNELPEPFEGTSVVLNGVTLLTLMVITTLVYPPLAIFVESALHGINFKRRSFSSEQAAGSTIVVDVQELQKTFEPSWMEQLFKRKKATSLTAVNGVQLQGHKGQIICLVGPNGSGKTTTLQMMAGLLPISNGEIHINALPSQLGICPQQHTFWSELTVDEHIHIWNHIKGGRQSKEELDAILAGCDLIHKTKSRVKSLSGGQMRKLQLACMFVGDSSVCLVDECTSGLDPLSRRVIWDILLQQRTRRSIIFTTHFLDEVEVLADHIVILSNGEVKCHGPTTTLKQLHGGGYKVSVPRSEAPADESYTYTVHQDSLIYKTPDSGSAAQLATKLAAAGQTNVSVAGPQVEDVFLRVADDAALTVNDGEIAASASGLDLTPGKVASFWTQVKALFWKRLVVLKTFWWPYIYVLILPIAITPALSTLMKGYETPICFYLPPALGVAWPFSIFYHPETTQRPPRAGPGLLLGGPPVMNETLYNLMSSGAPIAQSFNMSYYDEWMRPVSTLDEFMGYVRANSSRISPGGLFMDNTTAPTIASDATLGINAGLQLFNFYTQIRLGTNIRTSLGTFAQILPRMENIGMVYVLFFCLVQAIYPAAFVLYPAIEKKRRVRAIGYANGVRRAPLWVAYALFDFMFVALISIALAATLTIQIPNWLGSPWAMLPIIGLYGMAALLFSYIMSVFFQSAPTAFMATASANIFMFCFVVLAFLVPSMTVDAGKVDSIITATTFTLNFIFPIGNVFRACSYAINVNEISCGTGDLISPWSIYGYGGPILYLIIQVAALLGILIWLEKDHDAPKIGSAKKHGADPGSEKALNPVSQEVKLETLRVEQSAEDPLRVVDITKSFGNNVAVDHVSVGIASGEILALLGPNGAGKSTLVNLIRGDLRPDSGNGYLCGEHTRSVTAKTHLGVCPQHDSLDMMSTEEHLAFFARIKGVNDVQRNVALIMEKLGLTPYAKRQASALSGGNKRKLSLAIALMGTPPILVLDEPTSAMDAVAKRAFWRIIQEISPNRSLLLTTHSMEEADTIASRAAVMSQRLLAVDTTQALRQKYSNVYYVQLLLKSAPTSTLQEMTEVWDWIQDFVPGAAIEREVLGGQIRFTVAGTRAPSNETEDAETIAQSRNVSPVVELIEQLEQVKESLGIEYYSIGEATLEGVFLSVMRENNITANDVEAPKRRSRRK